MFMFPKPNLDTRSDIPLYRQLYAYLVELIRSGRIGKGERLPATRELAAQLGLNRTTVSAAYELLVSEGLIAGHVGRGSFVTGGSEAGSSAEARGLDWDALLEHSENVPAHLHTAGRDTISFATSRPSEELFPLDAFRASCDEVMADAGFASVLQLGSPGGYEPLRQYLLETARAQGLAGPGDDLIVTNGCQQGLDLIRRILVQPGDKVVLEDPVYPGLKNLLAQSGAQLLGVRVGPDGMDPDHLQHVLERERPKLIVLTANFQNPTGATLPLAARTAILRMAREAGAVLVENDIYGDMRYQGEAIPSLKQLDETGDTILLRSFSKLSFPGLRVGWAIGPSVAIARLVEAKHLSDLHTDQLSQAVLLRFAESGRLAAHCRRMLEAGAERLGAVLSACDRFLPAGSRYTRPQGGMNLWVRLPEPLDAGELLPRAQRESVTYLPGKFFTVSRHEPGGLRLSFAGLAPEKIQKGLAILGEIFSSELERTRAQRDWQPAPAMV